MKQVNISRNLDHPCITKVLEVFNSEKLFVIAMEYAPGGELFDQVVKEYGEEFMNEETAKLRFYQISHATAHLHVGKVCHRDLKLESILLMSTSPYSQFCAVQRATVMIYWVEFHQKPIVAVRCSLAYIVQWHMTLPRHL